MQVKRLVTSILFFMMCLHLLAQDDKVYSKNGDVLIGELKSMSRGVLVFDTDYADSDFQIDWDEVDGLEIGVQHIIYVADGSRYIGGLKPLLGQGRLIRLITANGEITMSLGEIVEIIALEKNLWDRINISIDAGLSITKAHNVRQRSVASNLNYRGNKWLLTAYFNDVGTTQDDVDPIERTDGRVSLTRDVFGNAMAFGGMEFLSSSESQLDLRSTGKLGGGYYFIRNNRIYFFGGAGMAVSNEKYGGENPTQNNNLEGLVQTEFNAYNMGDFSLLAKMMAYPSMSDKGRWKINSDIVLKYDLPLDFYIKITLTHNYDSKSPVDNSPETDYSFQSGFGWEWN